jgi:hypothetical protein
MSTAHKPGLQETIVVAASPKAGPRTARLDDGRTDARNVDQGRVLDTHPFAERSREADDAVADTLAAALRLCVKAGRSNSACSPGTESAL